MTQLTLDALLLARRSDPATSHEAGAIVEPHLSDLQSRVLAAFAAYGAMSARTAEQLSRFDGCSPSTVRKRISELHRAGMLVECGVDRSGRAPCTLYRCAP